MHAAGGGETRVEGSGGDQDFTSALVSATTGTEEWDYLPGHRLQEYLAYVAEAEEARSVRELSPERRQQGTDIWDDEGCVKYFQQGPRP